MLTIQLTCKLFFFSDNWKFTDMLFSTHVKTTSALKMKVYRGCCGGLSLKIPVSNTHIFGCLPIDFPLIKVWHAEIAN